MLATEVGGMWDLDIGKKRKEIIDCVGIKKVRIAPRKFHYDMKGIELIQDSNQKKHISRSRK